MNKNGVDRDDARDFQGQIMIGVLGIHCEKEDVKLLIFINNVILYVEYPI